MSCSKILNIISNLITFSKQNKREYKITFKTFLQIKISELKSNNRHIPIITILLNI